MSDEELPVSDLLASRRVIEASPEFWRNLEAQLAAEPAPNTNERTTIVGRVGDPIANVDTGDTPATDLTARRARRWALAVAATAAAVIAAVIGLNVIGEDDPPTITDTPSTTSTTAGPSEDDAAPGSVDWTRQPTGIAADVMGRGPLMVSTDATIYALDVNAETASAGLLRSEDGVAWDDVDASVLSVGGVTPSWSDDEGSSEYEPAALAANGETIAVAEVTDRGTRPGGVRIWRSGNGADWSLVELPPAEPGVDATLDLRQTVTLGASPDVLVVARELRYNVDWMGFVPEDTRLEVESQLRANGIQFSEGDSLAQAGGSGISFGLTDVPTIPWDNLPPRSREIYDWWRSVEFGGQSEFYVIDPAGEVTRLDGPCPGVPFESISSDGPLLIAACLDGTHARSEDGRTWSELTNLSLGRFPAVVFDNSLFVPNDSDGELLVSTDFGATFAPVDVPLPEAEGGSDNGNPAWVFVPGLVSVQQGTLTAVIWRNGAPRDGEWLASSTDGSVWSVTQLDPPPEGVVQQPVFAIARPDGTRLVYREDGTVDIGRSQG